MEHAYGAGKAGGAFDFLSFIQQPQPILRILSWLFSIVIFGCIANEGYINPPEKEEEYCIFNRNYSACNYGVTMGSLTFLTAIAFLALDVYFPQISGVKDRKKVVIADIGVSAFWSFMWFVGFCFLTNQWQLTEDIPLNNMGADAARAAITFSFFSIFTWGVLTVLAVERMKRVSFEEEYDKLFTPQAPLPTAGQAFLAFQRYKLGASSTLFSQDYTDPSQDVAASSEFMEHTGDTEEGSKHANYDGSTGYQSQEY